MKYLREKQINVSGEVFNALWLLAKAQNGGDAVSTSYQDKPRTCTPDEIADDILKRDLKTRYPQLFEYQKAEAKREQELIETLRK